MSQALYLLYKQLNHLLLKAGADRTQVLELGSGADRTDAVTGVLKYRKLFDTPIGSKPQSLVAVQLETGRKHQIRAQLSHVGHPIVGDAKYGAPQRMKSRDIALHASVLSFAHPITQTQV